VKKRILVVDDERPILELLKFKLSNRGYEVLTARDVKEFWDQALSQELDLIILDIWLRGWIGTQVYGELLDRGFDETIPVIFITALLDEETQAGTGASGKYALYRKPFDFDEFMGQVERMLAEHSNDERSRPDENEKSNPSNDQSDGDSLTFSFSEPNGVR